MDLKAEDLNKIVDAPADSDEDEDDGDNAEENERNNKENESRDTNNKKEEEEDINATRESDEFCFPNTPYSELINCTFMPNDFQYVPIWRSSNAIDYISISNDENEAEKKRKELQDLAGQIAYSRIMRKSQIWDEARPESSGTSGFYRFRPLYHDQIFLPSEMEKKNKINYRADPFSAVLKKSYLQTAERNKSYVFYSLFDVDAFMRITFYNKKKKGYREYIYRKINRLLCNKTDGKPHPPYEEELRKSISHLYPVNAPEKDIFDDKFINLIALVKEYPPVPPKKENVEKTEIENKNVKNTRSLFVKKIVERLLKQNINVWREWAGIICRFSELTAEDKVRAQKMRNNLNLKNRRKLWKSDIADFTYFLEKYPKLADMLQ